MITMKKTFLLLAVISLLVIAGALAQKGGPYTIADCTDSDGDDPATAGTVEWTYTDSAGYGSGINSDVCSEIHYLNVMMYAGEGFGIGEAVLVEGVCPEIGTIAEEPGDFAVAKYYKCKCRNIGESGEKGTENAIGVCTDAPEEIPYERVKAADEKWMESGKGELHPLLVRFLSLLGLWG